MKHTPGPWYKSGLTIRADDSLSGSQPVIAEIQTEVGVDRASANARLIETAPELLAALKEIEGLGVGDWTCLTKVGLATRASRAVEIARAAVEKAEWKV